MSTAIDVSTPHTSVRSKPPHSLGIPPGQQEVGNDPALPGVALGDLDQALQRGPGFLGKACYASSGSSSASAARVANSSASASASRAGRRRFRAFQMRGGMRGRVNLLQQIDRDPRVQLRGRELGVPEHLLDHADVGAVLQHQRGHRVAEQVAAAHLADLRFRAGSCAPATSDAPRSNGSPRLRQKHRAVVGRWPAARAAPRGCICRSRPAPARRSGCTRSFLPLPWRIVTVPRSASMSYSFQVAPLPCAACRSSRRFPGWRGRADLRAS